MGSNQESIGGHPLTGSSMMGSQLESIGGHPLTGSSMMGSNMDSMGGIPATHTSLLATDEQLDRDLTAPVPLSIEDMLSQTLFFQAT